MPYKMSPSDFGTDPMGAEQAFQRFTLEKIRFALQTKFSRALLAKMRFERAPEIEYNAEYCAYRLEAFVFGRNAWEETIETRKDTLPDKVTESEETQEKGWAYRPETWLDHLHLTFKRWTQKKRRHSILGIPEPNQVERARQWFWKTLCDVTDERLPCKMEQIPVILYQKVTHRTETTIHDITVKKHYHLCPHLNIKTERPHLEFLAGPTAGGF